MDQVVIRSVNEYWNDFILEGLKKDISKTLIRKQLIEAFKKEQFGLITLRVKGGFEETPQSVRIVTNVAREIHNKWISLWRRCQQYKETVGLISPDDLAEKDGDTDGDEDTREKLTQ